MRDIRQDLQERIAILDSERSQLQHKIQHLNEQRHTLEAILQAEEERWKTSSANQHPLFASESGEAERTPYATFIRETMSDHKAWSLNELKQLAAERNISFGDKNPGRVLHFALIGMAQNGIVEPVASGVWRMREPMNGTQ